MTATSVFALFFTNWLCATATAPFLVCTYVRMYTMCNLCSLPLSWPRICHRKAQRIYMTKTEGIKESSIKNTCPANLFPCEKWRWKIWNASLQTDMSLTVTLLSGTLRWAFSALSLESEIFFVFHLCHLCSLRWFCSTTCSPSNNVENALKFEIYVWRQLVFFSSLFLSASSA